MEPPYSDSTAKRGPIDRHKFFSRSPFRSLSFLVVTTLCFSGVVLGLWIIYLGWRHWSVYFPSGLIVFICGFVYPWWRALLYHEKMEQLYSDGSISDVTPGSALDVALSVAAGGINDLLFYCFTTMGALLAYIGYLLKHCR